LNNINFLTIDKISASYNSLSPVVNNISFSLNVGELGCLLGPSGCGKTTILKAVSGFQNLTSGEILLDGISLSKPNKIVEPEKRSIGMVFQDHSLFPHLSISENIGFGLNKKSKHNRDETINNMLRLIGLEDQANKYPHELSGGQNQRVALARAIAPKPKLLLMDEPFSNLDSELRESLGFEVRAILKEQNITAIMVTHDQNDAFALGDQIGVMSEGKLLQWDSSYNLYHLPKSRFVAQFIGDGVFVKGRMINEGVVLTSFGEVQYKINGQNNASKFVGKDVDLFLRPDDVKHDPKSSIRGHVIRKTFKGSQSLYTIKIESGDELMSLAPSQEEMKIGETIGLTIVADRLICFEQ